MKVKSSYNLRSQAANNTAPYQNTRSGKWANMRVKHATRDLCTIVNRCSTNPDDYCVSVGTTFVRQGASLSSMPRDFTFRSAEGESRVARWQGTPCSIHRASDGSIQKATWSPPSYNYIYYPMGGSCNPVSWCGALVYPIGFTFSLDGVDDCVVKGPSDDICTEAQFRELTRNFNRQHNILDDVYQSTEYKEATQLYDEVTAVTQANAAPLPAPSQWLPTTLLSTLAIGSTFLLS